jgi:phosphoglycolate phosphatase-like HAD superfamily hydrolase
MNIQLTNQDAQQAVDLKTRLVFFDMDRTILDASVFHRKNIQDVLNQLFGVRSLARAETSGYPYLEVARIYARAAGIGEGFLLSHQSEMETLLVENMLGLLPEDLSAYVFPGAIELLEKLKDERIALGLTTGSLRGFAVPMLKRSGLLKYFPVTSFGDQVESREQILSRGLEQAAWVYGIPSEHFQLVTIGDAPADIRAGKAFGARTISIASGVYSMDQLSAFRPDYVFQNILNTQAIFEKITAEKFEI